MSLPITEVAWIPLKAGVDLSDESGDTGKVWKSTLDTIRAQDGFQRASWGNQEEAADTVTLLIDWNTLQDHKNFMASPEYQPFLKHLGSIISDAPTLFHVPIQPGLNTSVTNKTSAPVTECLALYFPSDVSDEQQHKVQDLIQSFASKLIEANPENPRTCATGWSIEKEAVMGKEGTSGKSRVLIGLLGWESKQAHMDCTKTTVFKENTSMVNGLSELTEMRHVAFRQV